MNPDRVSSDSWSRQDIIALLQLLTTIIIGLICGIWGLTVKRSKQDPIQFNEVPLKLQDHLAHMLIHPQLFDAITISTIPIESFPQYRLVLLKRNHGTCFSLVLNS